VSNFATEEDADEYAKTFGFVKDVDSRPRYVVRLTLSQRMALADIIALHMTALDEPQEFIDVSSDVTTTSGELLRLVLESESESVQ